LSHFLSKLHRKANDAGWGKISKNKGHDIFQIYGLFTVQEAKRKADTQFQFDSAGNWTIKREPQASLQMMTFLMNSYSPECLNNVSNSSEDHIITSSTGESTEDRPLFLHVLNS